MPEAAQKFINSRKRNEVLLSKAFDTGRNAAKIAEKLGYKIVHNPGNTRKPADPRAKNNPFYGIRVRREVGMKSPDGMSRADHMSWYVSSLGNMAVQIYVSPTFTGDPIQACIKLIAKLNEYMNRRRTEMFTKTNAKFAANELFERYIFKPKTMHPRIKALEAKGWPRWVQGKDIDTATAEHYGYKRCQNPAREDGKFLGKAIRSNRLVECMMDGYKNIETEHRTVITIYERISSLPVDRDESLLDFLKEIRK